MSTKRAGNTLEVELLEQDVSFDYSETWLGYSLLGLRLVMAWIFLQAGLEKLADGGWTNVGSWTAEGYLLHGVADANPLKDVFVFFADFLWLVDPLIIFGQILIGLALLFGVFFRLAALMGIFQMFFFWTGGWEAGIAAGFPVEHGYFVTSELVYLLLLFGLGAWGAGRLAGIDAKLEATEFVENNRWLRYLLG